MSANNRDIGCLTLDDFKLWSTRALKVFLSLRGKPATCSFDTLAARAFATYETGEPIDSEREHIERKLLDEYKGKLVVDNKNLQDPLDIKNGWVGEENGIKLWPQLYLTDITRFYGDVLGKKNIVQRIECEYKQGKAYRYFTDSFISEVFYNNISDESKYCYLKTKCLPSQRVSSKPYDVWALVKKDFKYEVGGAILSAYCTCTAGLLGSCNHVAGLLFRVEAAVLIGVTHPTCTSMLASWNVPSKKKQVIPGRIKDFLFKSESYTKKSLELDSLDRLKKKAERRTFLTMSNSQFIHLSDKKKVRSELFEAIADIVPKSCFVELMAGQKVRVEKSQINVSTLTEFAESFIDGCDPELDVSSLTEIFADSISLTAQQINSIYEQTIDQSKSTFWIINQRHGRITSSRFNEIKNLAEKMQKDVSYLCPEYLTAAIMGYEKPVVTWQMKHGINTEMHAKHKYKSLTRRFHKNMTYNNPGMTVFEEYPYLSATPDMEINCNCRGPGLVEIKCPATLIGKIPSIENYSKHIEKDGDKLQLKSTSPYYSQIQGQLAATDRLYCDWFVFSFRGNLTIRVKYNDLYWKRLLSGLRWFWRTVIADELLTKKLKYKMEKIYDEDSLVAINKPKTSFSLEESDLNLTNEILTDNNELIIVTDK